MLKKICFFFIFLLPTVVFAGGGNAVDSYRNFWSGGAVTDNVVCKAHNIVGTACIGDSAKDGCKTGPDTYKARQSYATSSRMILMMVARKVNKNCAYLCPTQVEAVCSGEGGDVWTEYADADRGNDCVWLCKDGDWSDAGLNSDYCDSRQLKQDNYKGVARVISGANIENSVAMFDWDRWVECGGGSADQEHDVILAIDKYVKSGHGAVVKQMVVASAREGWDPMVSWPNIYPAEGAEDILTCLPGFTPNSAGTDCVAKTNKCNMDEKLSKLCDGWSRDGFSADKHYLVDDASGCVQYRCLVPGEAFVSNSSKSCAPCVEKIGKDGIKKDGTCEHCPIGQIFSSDDDKCINQKSLSKYDLQFGKEDSGVWKEQCWALDMNKYKTCVLGNK